MVAEKPDLLLDWMPSRLSSLLLGWLRYAVLDKLLGCRFRRSRFQKKNRLFFFLFFLPPFFFFLRSPLFFFFLPPFLFFFFLPSSLESGSDGVPASSFSLFSFPDPPPALHCRSFPRNPTWNESL